MKKKEIQNFVNECNKGVNEARNSVSKLNSTQIVELRANIKAELVKLDKWNIFLTFVALAIATLALSDCGCMNNKSDNTFLIGYLILIVSFVAIVLYLVDQYKKARRIKALSYLDDYVDKSIGLSTNLHNSELQCETIEQLRQRHKQEMRQALKKWEEQKRIAEEQIELYEMELGKDNK